MEEKLAELQKPVCTCYLLEPEIKGAFDFTDPKDKPVDLSKYSFENNDYEIIITFLKVHESAAYPTIELRHFNHENLNDYGYYYREKPENWSSEQVFRQIPAALLKTASESLITDAVRYFEAQCYIKSVKLSQLIPE